MNTGTMILLLKNSQSRFDENVNCITMTDDDIFDQPLQQKHISTDKLNTKNYEQLCTKHRDSANVESMSTDSDNEGMELVEDQAAINHRQELTGDPLPSVLQIKNLEKPNISVCTWGK